MTAVNSLFLGGAGVATQRLERLRRHRENINRIARELGLDFASASTGDAANNNCAEVELLGTSTDYGGLRHGIAPPVESKPFASTGSDADCSSSALENETVPFSLSEGQGATNSLTSALQSSTHVSGVGQLISEPLGERFPPSQISVDELPCTSFSHSGSESGGLPISREPIVGITATGLKTSSSSQRSPPPSSAPSFSSNANGTQRGEIPTEPTEAKSDTLSSSSTKGKPPHFQGIIQDWLRHYSDFQTCMETGEGAIQDGCDGVATEALRNSECFADHVDHVEDELARIKRELGLDTWPSVPARQDDWTVDLHPDADPIRTRAGETSFGPNANAVAGSLDLLGNSVSWDLSVDMPGGTLSGLSALERAATRFGAAASSSAPRDSGNADRLLGSFSFDSLRFSADSLLIQDEPMPSSFKEDDQSVNLDSEVGQSPRRTAVHPRQSNASFTLMGSVDQLIGTGKGADPLMERIRMLEDEVKRLGGSKLPDNEETKVQVSLITVSTSTDKPSSTAPSEPELNQGQGVDIEIARPESEPALTSSAERNGKQDQNESLVQPDVPLLEEHSVAEEPSAKTVESPAFPTDDFADCPGGALQKPPPGSAMFSTHTMARDEGKIRRKHVESGTLLPPPPVVSTSAASLLSPTGTDGPESETPDALLPLQACATDPASNRSAPVESEETGPECPIPRANPVTPPVGEILQTPFQVETGTCTASDADLGAAVPSGPADESAGPVRSPGGHILRECSERSATHAPPQCIVADTSRTQPRSVAVGPDEPIWCEHQALDAHSDVSDTAAIRRRAVDNGTDCFLQSEAVPRGIGSPGISNVHPSAPLQDYVYNLPPGGIGSGRLPRRSGITGNEFMWLGRRRHVLLPHPSSPKARIDVPLPLRQPVTGTPDGQAALLQRAYDIYRQQQLDLAFVDPSARTFGCRAGGACWTNA